MSNRLLVFDVAPWNSMLVGRNIGTVIKDPMEGLVKYHSTAE